MEAGDSPFKPFCTNYSKWRFEHAYPQTVVKKNDGQPWNPWSLYQYIHVTFLQTKMSVICNKDRLNCIFQGQHDYY